MTKILEQIGIEEIPWSDKREDNLERYGDDINSCLICGKPIKTIKYWLNTVEGPDMIYNDVTDEDLEANGLTSQGAFPIGRSCKKKLPKGYITK